MRNWEKKQSFYLLFVESSSQSGNYWNIIYNYRGILKPLSKVYDGAFFGKYVTGKSASKLYLWCVARFGTFAQFKKEKNTHGGVSLFV